jgi:Colicin V production protein
VVVIDGMTIWLLALLWLAILAGLGYRQGAIRVAFSLLGILLGVLLAGPLGKLIKPLIMMVGLKNPMIVGPLAPLLAFIVISLIFKAIALAVHQKVDVYFKYKAGDLRLALWERLNHRLGLCLGLLNGTVYFILSAWAIYALSYWTVQTGGGDSNPTTLKVLNRLGEDLGGSGFIKVARAMDRMPETYYQTADIAGLVYNNPLLEARLSRYPAFVGLAERPEFQTLASDQSFKQMRDTGEPVLKLLSHPSVQNILGNHDLVDSIRKTLVPNLTDLRTFLETGRSPKYESENILGRWVFDVNYTLLAIRKAKPNLPSSELSKMKKGLMAAYGKTALAVTTDNKVILKNLPPSLSQQPTLEGQWSGAQGKYMVTLPEKGEVSANVDGDRLTMSGGGVELSFAREE